MIPDPLHPAMVHFPIVLALLLPLVVAAAFVALKRGTRPQTAWLPVVGVGALLIVSTWATVQTGEQEEDAVERAVAEETLHTHEEAAERFLILSLVTAIVIAVGVAPGRAGQIARGGSALMSVVVAVAVFGVGRTGGELVYVHGAAQVYASATPGAKSGSTRTDLHRGRERDEEDDEGDEDDDDHDDEHERRR